MSRTRDTRCCYERLLFRTGNRKALGYLCALGESVRVGRKNSRRGAAGQILGDSGKRSQTGRSTDPGLSRKKRQRVTSGKTENISACRAFIFVDRLVNDNDRGEANVSQV